VIENIPDAAFESMQSDAILAGIATQPVLQLARMDLVASAWFVDRNMYWRYHSPAFAQLLQACGGGLKERSGFNDNRTRQSSGIHASHCTDLPAHTG
jgi:hypothetical protein